MGELVIYKKEDVLLHTKSSENENTPSVTFPVTRWENVLGAPRLLSATDMEKSFPSQYAFVQTGEITITDEEYNACFGMI